MYHWYILQKVFVCRWSELDKPGPLAEVVVENKAIIDEPEAKRARRKASAKQDEETLSGRFNTHLRHDDAVSVLAAGQFEP